MSRELNLKQETFCKEYISNRGNGVRSYCNAFELDFDNIKDYNSAKSNAFRLLTNDNILARIKELLEQVGLNDSFVDNELKHLIWQDEDLNAKAKGIDIYNKIRRRYTEDQEKKVINYVAKFG